MRYLMTIKRIETNEQYKQELKDWEDRIKYNHPDHYNGPIPVAETEQLSLQTIINEDELNIIKKAVLETFK